MKTPVARSRNPQWTEAEDERLRAFVAQGASVIRVSAALKRKVISVRQRARKIGCPFPPLRIAWQKWADTRDDAGRRD
jgi:hypothetical protein